jgi:hypothetical protein
MATDIDVEWVSAVLLADGWHIIQPGTFRVDDYVFSGEHAAEMPPQKGYVFIKVDQLTRAVQHYVGPLTYVLGVRYDIPTEIVDDDLTQARP